MRSFVGEISRAGNITMHPLDEPAAQIHRIAATHDDALWFTVTVGGRIPRTVDTFPGLVGGRPVVARMDSSGSITEFNVPNQTGVVNPIAAASDNSAWVVEGYSTQDYTPRQDLLHVSPSGDFTTIVLPPTVGFVTTLVEGPDGAMWLGSLTAVGRVESGVVSVFPVPEGVFPTRNLVAGPEGALWFGLFGGLLRVSTDGKATQVKYAGPPCLTEIAATTDAVWCAENSGVSKIDAKGRVARYEHERRRDFLNITSSLTLGMIRGLALDSDGTLWLTDPEAPWNAGPAIGHIT